MKTDVVSIIDDDKIYKFTILKTIESVDIVKKVHVFGDGEEGIKYITDNIENPDALPDIIFLDLNMPYMDGWEFLDMFSGFKESLPKKIIIYIVSSSVSELDIQKAKQYETVTDYIVKPISIDKFKVLIEGIKGM